MSKMRVILYFNLRDPDETLSAAGESAIREVVGKNSMDFIITEGREEIAANTKDLLAEIAWMNINQALMYRL